MQAQSQFIKTPEIRWADLDPNDHLRHSVYYDYGAYCRISYFEENGISTSVLRAMGIGPIIFREEAVFRKEIRMGDRLTIDLQVFKSRKDFSRWSIRHQIVKNETELAAVLTLDGAWINTVLRKLATPPENLARAFDAMPKAPDFAWL